MTLLSQPPTMYFPDGRDPHGYMSIAWEDYRVPANFWQRLERWGERDCWLWRGRKDMNPRVAMASRLGVNRDDILAAIPSCGVIECCNPKHTCLTMVAKR